MKINTSKFGEVEVNEDFIFNFIEPILGYENLKKYTLIDHLPGSPFKWLQSIEDPNVSFPVTYPGFFELDYKFVIPEENVKKLEITNHESVLSINIACIPPGNPQLATINLLGPIIINIDNRKAMQIVLLNTNYSVKQKLFPNGIEKSMETPGSEKA